MASNPFHPDNLAPTWAEATSILKGDLPGHPFHGNQYVGEFTGGAANEAVKNGAKIVNAYKSGRLNRDQLRQLLTNERDVGQDTLRGFHRAASMSHDQIAEDMGGGNNFVDEADYAENHNDEANAHEDASSAHRQAAIAANNVVKNIDNNVDEATLVRSLDTYFAASLNAQAASEKADATTPEHLR